MTDDQQRGGAKMVEVGDYVRVEANNVFFGKHYRFELLRPHVAVVTKLGKKWIHFKILHPQIKKGMRKILMRYDSNDFRILKEA